MWTFKQIDPQPARGALLESMWASDDWIAEEKYDGDRRIAQFCGDPKNPQVRFTGRRKSVSDGLFVEKTKNLPHLAFKTPPRVMKALDGTVLDGEIVFNPANMPDFQVDGGRSKYVTSIMGSLPAEAIRKQEERGWLKYVVFDCLFYKGEDVRGLPLWKRGQYAGQAVKEWANEHVALALSKGGRFKKEFLRDILDRGGEGVILKHRDHTYGQKNLWVKYKAVWTADVVIMGYKDAKEMSKKKGDEQATQTKYAKAGLIGALACGQYTDGTLVEIATVSGMDDQLRRTLTLEGKDYLGLVIEIAHNGREPTGRFRHPRFKRFRPDKEAAACVYRAGEI